MVAIKYGHSAALRSDGLALKSCKVGVLLRTRICIICSSFWALFLFIYLSQLGRMFELLFDLVVVLGLSICFVCVHDYMPELREYSCLAECI